MWHLRNRAFAAYFGVLYMTVDDFRLVIINDDPDDAARLRQCLLRGFEREVTLVEAATGNEGLGACLGPGVPKPDCVIVDLHLPDMSGLEVLERLKDGSGDPLFPVVLFVDSGSDCRAAAAALRAGAQDYIGKTWLTADGLACAVENAIMRHEMLVRLRMKRAALDRRDREFKALVENAAADIITRFDTRFRHLYVNPAIERATGLSPDHFIGKTSRDAGMPESLCDSWEAKLREVIEGRREIGFEFEFESPAGRRAYQSTSRPRALGDRGGRVGPRRLDGDHRPEASRGRRQDERREGADAAPPSSRPS